VSAPVDVEGIRSRALELIAANRSYEASAYAILDLVREVERLRGLIEEAASVGVYSTSRPYVAAIGKLAKSIDWPWTLQKSEAP
jgi:hypothetical protein